MYGSKLAIASSMGVRRAPPCASAFFKRESLTHHEAIRLDGRAARSGRHRLGRVPERGNEGGHSPTLWLFKSLSTRPSAQAGSRDPPRPTASTRSRHSVATPIAATATCPPCTCCSVDNTEIWLRRLAAEGT